MTGKAKVYFSKTITPQEVTRLYKLLNIELTGHVGVKLHSGEMGNKYFLRPVFLKDAIDYVNGTVVECNTAYKGSRNTSEVHWNTMKEHEWLKYFKVDLMDEEGETILPVTDGIHLKENFVGSHFGNYDSFLVLSHFKGHPMGGFGGALKNISIGFASSHGKAHIHGAGDPSRLWSTERDLFLESMADAAKSIMDNKKGKIAFVNIMKNLSVDCDCTSKPEPPKMADIGILSSLDPVALDMACVDLVYASNDPGKGHLIERMESRHGIHTIEAAVQIGVGTCEYELIDVTAI